MRTLNCEIEPITMLLGRPMRAPFVHTPLAYDREDIAGRNLLGLHFGTTSDTVTLGYNGAPRCAVTAVR
jgi:hypothetical protein